jgi:hypothetical protein
VGRTTYEHTQAPNTEWYNEPNEVAVLGMAEALGIDPDYFAKNWNHYNSNSFCPNDRFWFKHI